MNTNSMDTLNEEELKKLSNKVEDGTATEEEVVQFLQIINKSLTGFQKQITGMKI